jgi:7-cyano-7-deazaguanine synthase
MVSAKKAIVLLSGGIDSSTILAIAKSEGFDCYALSFQYGQRHFLELEAAGRIALAARVCEHYIISIDLTQFGHSALTDYRLDVPKDRPNLENHNLIPITYVPARNTIFLSYSLAWAEAIECFDIFIGVNAMDYSGYPDCRGEYITAFEKMANLATAAAVSGKGRYSIHTPLVEMTKAQIILRGNQLGVDFSMTHSCYDPSEDGLSCGKCDSCRLRLKGFAEAGITDPVQYRK